jgi:nitroimidazol reductase NimA-like FMN-containing flavoprotein (pyridoxamine 5'-phosphate oxidase superfamily)
MAGDVEPEGLIRLDEAGCWRFLAAHAQGRVGLVHLGHPLVFPVNYAVDGRAVVFRTAPGTKLTAAAAGAEVVFEVDEATALFETGTSVMVHGTLHEVTDPGERARLARLPIRTWAPGDRDHVLRVEPRWVSGRRIAGHLEDDGVTTDGG